MPTEYQFNNMWYTSNGCEEKSDDDAWLAYSHKNGKWGKAKIAFIKKNVYARLSRTDYVSVDSGEITNDPNTYKKNKKQIKTRLYYEVNSESPAIFGKQEIRSLSGAIERRGVKLYRTGTNTVLCTYDTKCRLKTRVKKLIKNGTKVGKDISHQGLSSNLGFNKNTENNVDEYTSASNDLWMAYSYELNNERGYPRIAFIKKGTYSNLSNNERVSVYNNEIITNSIVSDDTKDKKQITNFLYYEICSTSPALFTEEEVKQPGGPITRRAGTSYRTGTSIVVLTYDAKCRIMSRLKRRFNEGYIDATSSAEKTFEMTQDKTTANTEAQNNSNDQEVYAIPEDILKEMLIDNPFELLEESISFFNCIEKEDHEVINDATDNYENLTTDNNSRELTSTELITNFDEAFSDPYWEQFKERDDEAVNVNEEHQYSFRLFQTTIADLRKHDFDLDESRKPKRYKSNV